MNNLSLLDRIIVNQTFSIKVLEEGENEEIKPEDVNNSNTKSTQIVPKGAKMYYVAPDASQSNVILNKVERDVAEIYRKVSLMSSDTRQESGVAKSFNFSNFNSVLAKVASYFETDVFKWKAECFIVWCNFRFNNTSSNGKYIALQCYC